VVVSDTGLPEEAREALTEHSVELITADATTSRMELTAQ
jgi:hypothetical protein